MENFSIIIRPVDSHAGQALEKIEMPNQDSPLPRCSSRAGVLYFTFHRLQKFG